MIKVLIKLLDVLETHTVQKKENLSFMLADSDKKYVEFKCPLDPAGDLDDDSNVYKKSESAKYHFICHWILWVSQRTVSLVWCQGHIQWQ
jgi:hypothetical protein